MVAGLARSRESKAAVVIRQSTSGLGGERAGLQSEASAARAVRSQEGTERLDLEGFAAGEQSEKRRNEA